MTEIERAPDVLIVAYPGDRLADRLVAAIEARGRVALRLDGAEAARLIRVTSGASHAEIWPDLPMFIRAAGWGATENTPDAEFVRSECHAAFWAAAALTQRTVINRPGPDGTLWSLTSSALGDGPGGREILASAPSLLAADDPAIWGENSDFRVAPAASLPAGLPVRARTPDANAAYELVTIVGREAFVATCDERSERHRLAERSLALAVRHRLAFATITWEVSDDAATALRLNAFPDETELRYRMDDVIEALCAELLA